MFELIVGFLIILAIFDLVVGVSNDAVNFMNSGIGAKAARFRTIMAVSAIGVFAGAAMSNGMMDIARHGILMPEYFTFYEVMCVFLAVMVTDVILLDIFNTLGMPTSTTVSLVFELLGGAFALAILKIINEATGPDGTLLGLGELLNTEKAISVVLGIFLSVAIA
ncbi:MAG: inorganic phosphate transporter, partial [Bacteroidaceae bacterium]|nr:inorganic phosphate transporter [Bacteroidaceae bacterium]